MRIYDLFSKCKDEAEAVDKKIIRGEGETIDQFKLVGWALGVYLLYLPTLIEDRWIGDE